MKLEVNTAACLGLLLFFTFAIHDIFAIESCKISKSMLCTRNMSINEKYVLVKIPKPYLCDTKTDGGGWIIIQRRVHNDTNFIRNWTDYKLGFGSPCTQGYWLGNERLYQLTSKGQYELRIDMIYKEKNYFASYSSFKVDSETNQYKLTLGKFQGNVQNHFEYHNNMKFSTPDRDNDVDPSNNCAQIYRAGWWFRQCVSVNLNGPFGYEIRWASLNTNFTSMSSVEMKIRKIN